MRERGNNLLDIINTDFIIDSAVNEVFQTFGQQNLIIQQKYYTLIQLEMKKIEQYFQKKDRKKRVVQKGKLLNPYAPEFGFNESDIAYELMLEKKDSAIVYHSINKILSYIRQGQEMSYVLYVKDLNNRMYRYEVPESELENFLTIVQNTTFKADSDLRQFSEIAIQRLENAQLLSQHIENYMKAIDATGLSVKLADRYEAFEYHYQKIDNLMNNESFNHEFNIEGIRRWLLGRGHDTVGWWVRGDIGLTSVKSVNLNNKYLFLNLASKKSMQEVYQVIKEIFSDNILTPKKVSRLVKAFTPTVNELKKGIQIDVNKIVEDLISSLTNVK